MRKTIEEIGGAMRSTCLPAGAKLEDVDNLPGLDMIANELVEELQDALEQLQEIAQDLDRGAIKSTEGGV